MKYFVVIFALASCAIALPTYTEQPATQFLPLYKRQATYSDHLDRRIVGGSPATSATQFPYQVSLRASSHFCGASLISNVWIVSAAHCTVGASPSAIFAWVGTITLNTGGTRYTISRIINHPNYSSDSSENDISLIRTTNAVALSDSVSPINIGTTFIGGGIGAVLSGWGSTTTSGPTPNTLQWIDLQTITVDTCRQRLGSDIFDSSLCTFTRIGEGACFGDSGGPLAVNGVLVGVVSGGIPCAVGYPDVFTRVSSFVNWITTNAV